MDSTATIDRGKIDREEVKRAAAGQWVWLLRDICGLSAELLDGKGHPCPRCGGKDRFRVFPDVAETGGVICNKCGSFADGFATLQWLTDKTFSEVLRDVAEYLGVAADPSDNSPCDIVADVARVKRMPVDAFRQFGATAKTWNGSAVAVLPMHGGDGEPCSVFRIGKSGKLAKGLCEKGKPSGLFLPGRKPSPGETWLIVEGCKDGAALVGLGYLAVGLPTAVMATKFAGLFTGVNVVIVPDLDSAGQHGADTTAARLHGIAASVRVARLPGEIKASGGADVRDLLHDRNHGEAAVRAAIDNAKPWELKTADGSAGERPAVEITMNESAVVAAVLPALGNLGWTTGPAELRTFQRGGKLVHVVTDSSPFQGVELPDNSRRIRPLPFILVRERIAAAVSLFSERKMDDGPQRKTERPPSWMVGMIHERGEYPDCIRHLTGVVTAPTMRPDGSIVQVAGYDAATGLLLELTGDWPTIPDRPTRDDARRAADELLAVVADFPFVSPAHRAGWLAFVLTLLARLAIRGPTPLFLVDANNRGSGKTLLTDAAGVIATGDTLPVKTWTNNDDEIRKVITAVALEALPIVRLDNVGGRLGCPSLDAALTGTSWTDRLLGKNESTGTLPLTTVWAATGNNVVLEGDTARRTLLMRLESPEENPEERSGFAHPDLLDFVRAERRKLVAAGLTMLRAFVVAGRPDQQLPPWGSFSEWSNLIRNAIAWAGLADAAETRAITRAADRSAELVGLIHAGLLEAGAGDGDGVTASELIALTDRPLTDGTDPYPTLRAAVGELCGAKSKQDARRLGIELRKHLERVCSGRRLERMTDPHSKVARWRVTVCGDLRGPAGTFPSQSIFPLETDNARVKEERQNDIGLKHSPQLPALPARVCPECGSADFLADGRTKEGDVRTWCDRCEVVAIRRNGEEA